MRTGFDFFREYLSGLTEKLGISVTDGQYQLLYRVFTAVSEKTR